LHSTAVVEELGDYITVHHGCDTSKFTPGLRSGQQTKNWSTERWGDVISHLTAKYGLKVIQLGTKDEPELRGAITTFMGRTNVREAGLIIERALFHMDTEGGLVHLARAAHTPSVVLFGPTPVRFFGYPGNANITAGGCHDCWWSTEDWHTNCPRGLDTPECMDAVDAATVIREAERMYQRTRRNPAPCSLRDFVYFSPDLMKTREPLLRDIYAAAELRFNGPTSHSMNDETGSYVHGSKNWEYLYAVDQIEKHFGEQKNLRILDVGAGRGALSLYFAQRGHRSHIVDLTYSAHTHTGQEYGEKFLRSIENKVEARFGSAFCLPYDSASFDVVVCISVVEHLQHKQVALREMLRVLKPGGLAVLTFDVVPDNEGAEKLKDWNRVEIFTERKIAEDLARFGIELPAQLGALDRSLADMRSVGIAGIPEGLTVGGMVLRKEGAALLEFRKTELSSSG
jgi:SAM-dependent methyltransferase